MLKDSLTKQEIVVLKEVIMGKTNKTIAKELFLSQSTVKAHISSIIRKFQVTNRVEVAVKGLLFLKNQENFNFNL